MELLKFHEQLQSRRCFARMISVGHLDELKDEMEKMHHDGLFDQSFYQDSLTNFKYQLPEELPDARSIIVVAKPQPVITTVFRWNGREIPLIVPPSYADGPEVDAQVLSILNDVQRPESYRFIKTRLPIKSLAAHSGLVSYGRNNITYLPKFGSYHRLTAFFSDLPCQEDQWQDRELMAGCDTCHACLEACPTGAIAEDRFLLRAERCLTYLNEKGSNVAFPNWVDPGTHNALVGCMRCQRACPYNKGVQGWSEVRGVFTEEETAYLLEGTFTGDEAAAMEGKLKTMGLDLTIFPRNLAVLFRQKE
jgi:epoxyqueuosine reductase